MLRSSSLCLALLLVATSLPMLAQREPVLKQINEPHPYYFREMYLPQLTSGPSSSAWMPNSQTLVYSMAGSLWKQDVGSKTANQLTAGAGYDYQPDVSPDGRWAIYVCYLKDAVELWALDLENGQTHALTTEGAVNLEPRFSPDGRRVAFVSTSYHGRFHVFTADLDNGELKNVQRLTGENRTTLPRYYYSLFDHEISPAWSRDGTEIMFVSNRNHLYGTGGFWRMKAEPGAEAREIHYEETTWKARPEFSPDGKRIVYGSYLGGQWHQLWVMPAQGGDAFPISYGRYDDINPRWSPDGKHIAFISNREGNTSLWLQEMPGGKQEQVLASNWYYLANRPVGTLRIHVLDESGKTTAARLFVTGVDQRAYAPRDAWMNADDNFVRTERPFEAHYFHSSGDSVLTVPIGSVKVEVMKGFEYSFEQKTIEVQAAKEMQVTLRLHPLNIPHEADQQWASGDVHVHMNYGGAYRNTPRHLVFQAAAENLAIVEDLVVNKEQRVPDIAYFSTEMDSASTAKTLLLHGQEYHTSYWGHVGLLNLKSNFLLPGYSAYANTAAASLFPSNAQVADMAHAQQGLMGYVHPYDAVPDPAKDAALNHELPVDLALGKVDYMEVMGFAEHKSTASVWYRLLNCGFHLPTAAGTDAMANFASLRGPVGLNRVYAGMPKGPLAIEPWLEAIKKGRTFASNGPLLGFKLGGKELGETLSLPEGGEPVRFNAWLRSFVPVDHLELICDGKVAKDLKIEGDRETADIEDSVAISHSGWCLLRAWSDKAEHPVLDMYPYATTSPVYIKVAGAAAKATEDAAYFVAWIDRMMTAAKANVDWNNDSERNEILGELAAARKIYADME